MSDSTPKRGAYRWEDAAPGNWLALRHGGSSSRLPELVSPRTDELVEGIFSIAPHLDRDADLLAVRACALAEAVIERLAAYAAEHGIVDAERGKPSGVMEPLRSWMATAERARARLGLDPRSRAELAVDELHARSQARHLAEADLSEGRRLREEAGE